MRAPRKKADLSIVSGRAKHDGLRLPSRYTRPKGRDLVSLNDSVSGAVSRRGPGPRARSATRTRLAARGFGRKFFRDSTLLQIETVAT